MVNKQKVFAVTIFQIQQVIYMGCLRGAGEENRLRWFRDVVSLCDKYGIAYASWDYKGAFGIIDKGETQVEMLNILTGKE